MQVPRAALAAVVLAAGGCAMDGLGGTPPDLDPATAISEITREVEARVHYGFPGSWRWDLAYRSPESFRLSVRTAGATQHYVFDGSALESWVGDARVSRETRDEDGHASIGRWLGVTYLAALPASSELLDDPHGLGEDVFQALAFRFPDSPDPYRLGFDRSGRLLVAHGPVHIPGIGAGRMEARFRDFRPVAGRELPFAAEYRLNGQPFFDERVLRYSLDARIEPPRY